MHLLPMTMLKPYHILLLLTTVFSQCASNEISTFSPIYTLDEMFSLEEFNHFNDCSTNFNTLERALYLTNNNRVALISAFYPARQNSSLFVNVKYDFSTPQTERSICHNWLWTTGTFYLIQSPDVFLFTSLLFVHPENKVQTLHLKLPAECAPLAEICASNPNNVSMLEVLTRRLKLYARYNSLHYVSVSDGDAYAVKAVPVLDINTIYDQTVNTYFSFCIVFPIPIIIMLTVVCFKGSCLQLRVKLTNPRNFSSFASLATMGMLVSFFVVSLDICALIWAFDKHIDDKTNELRQSGFNSTIESHHIAIGTLVVDVVATVLSCIIFVVGLTMECGRFCCKRECDAYLTEDCHVSCMDCLFHCCLWPIFCCSKPEKSKEKMTWILVATSIAPIVCFGSHIGFVVLAWLADPKHAGGVSVIYLFMFFYYYITLKAFYQLLIDGKTGCLTCFCGKLTPTNYCCCCCCCNCLMKFNKTRKGYEALDHVNESNELESPEKEIEDHEHVFPDTHISFWAILLTGIFGMLLASLQVYLNASLVVLPLIGVIQDTPNYILSLFQVAVFLLTALITYAVLTAEEPVERELLKSVVRNFHHYYKKFPPQVQRRQEDQGEQPQAPPRHSAVQKVGNIVGALAVKQFNPDVIIKMDEDGN